MAPSRVRALPRPHGWPGRVRSAVVHAISLAHFSLTATRGWAANSWNVRIRLKEENDRLGQEIRLLLEELRIKDARMARIPAQRRPHYPPAERLAILELRAARGWSLSQSAARLLVTPVTVAAWMGRPRNRIRLRSEIAKGGRSGDVFLPDALLARFRRFWRHKATRREGLRPEDPLFCSQSRTRISPRRVQFAFRTWQVKAGFDRLYPLHALRHTAITNVYRASQDLFLAQRFARHVSPLTTTVYTHPSDQEMFERVRQLPC